ncbi:g1919 [Coccomyxa elongata]
MEALKYIDTLFKEYLLFRGFTTTLQTFNSDLASDRGCGFQVDQIVTMVFQKIIRQNRGKQLVEMLEFLDSQLYCHLDASYETTTRKLEVSLIKYFLVNALNGGKLNDVRSFFADFGDMLMSSPDSKEWSAWFALPYVQSPASHPTFQVYFTKEWAQLVETSFRNFLAEALQKMPLPAVLCFDTDRQLRLSLQRQCRQLQKEKAQLEKRLHENPALAASESGRLSLVDHIVDDDYAPSTSSSLSPGKHTTLPKEKRHDLKASQQQNSNQDRSSPRQLNHAAKDGRSNALPSATLDARKGTPGQEVRRQLGQNHRRDASFEEWAPNEPRHLISLEAQPEGLPEAPSSSRASSSSDFEKSAIRQAAVDQSTMSMAEAPQHFPSDASSCQAGRRSSSGMAPPTDRGGGELGSSSAEEGKISLLHRRLSSAEDAKGNIVMQAEELTGHDSAVVAAAFSPGGQNVATADRDGVVRIWAPQLLAADTGRSAVLLTGAPVSALAWDARADKIMLVGTVGKGIKAWHVDTKRMVAHVRLDPSFPDVCHVACSPADPSFACASSSSAHGPGSAAGKLSVWNMRAFKKAHTFAVAGDPVLDSLAFSPDGRLLLAAANDGLLRLFSTSAKSEVASWCVGKAGTPACARFGGSETSVIALTASGTLQWWDTAMLKEPVRTLDASAYCGTRAPHMKHAAAVSSDARALVLTSMTSQVPVLSEGAEAEWQFQVAGSHRGHITAVDWHPTMNVVISGSADHSACLTHLDL